MDNHLLFELTYVFYRVCSAIIHGECWLVKSSRKFCLFYPPRNGWLRNLAQRLFHNVNSYSFTRRTPAFPLMKMLFFTGEGFAWWSSRPLLVYSIFFINRGDIRAGRGSFFVLDRVASSSHQSLVAWLYYHLARGRCGFSFKKEIGRAHVWTPVT